MPQAIPRSTTTPLRILVIDDDRDTVQTLGVLFRSEGMEVEMLQTGTEALRTAETFLPDVVLLDIGMPEKNGYAVAKGLRKRFGRQFPTLVAVTGYSGLADRCQARVSGFDYYVVKPYDPRKLLELVSSLQTAHALS